MNLIRGWIGEKKTSFKLWLWLSGTKYRKFNNVIVPSSNGTTQIDHILVSEYGIFIIETKNKKGWIYGSKDQTKWTQTLYNTKYQFQNPIRQTFRQKKVLSEFLSVSENKINDVVYFVGSCKFKTELPSNVIKSGLGRYIKRFKKKPLKTHDVQRITNLLKKHISDNKYSNRDHRQSLKKRHSSKTICPKCGSHLVMRVAINGATAGSNFLGCTNYPKCRFTRSA